MGKRGEPGDVPRRTRWSARTFGAGALVLSILGACGGSTTTAGSQDAAVPREASAPEAGGDAGMDASIDASATDTGAEDVTDGGSSDVNDRGSGDVTDGSPGDVTDGASTDEPESSAPWTPSELPGLALWLDGTSGLSEGAGGALTWLDRSGQGNLAVSVGTPAIDHVAIGGKPAVHLNGSTDYLVVQDSPSLQFGANDFAIAVVAQHTTSGAGPWGYGLLFTKQVLATAPYYGLCIAANSVDRSGALFTQVANQSSSWIQTAETDFNTGRPFFAVVRRVSGTTLSLRVNGKDGASATGPGYAFDVSASGYPLRIGGTDKGQDVLGDIAEVIALQGSLSALDLANLEGYLAAKYGL